MKIMLPINGEMRTVRRFAFFPIRIGHEVRWLEMVTIHQTYYKDTGWFNDQFVK